MKEFKISINDSGQRLDKFITKSIPNLPDSLMRKYIRIKRIKVNNAKSTNNYRLLCGDTVQCYINDEFFEHTVKTFSSEYNPLNIVFEDENIILVNKPAGLLSHNEDGDETNTLIYDIRSYLYNTGAYNPETENSFIPSLCNRIDRNTSGIVIAAKTASALRILNEKIRDREITKKYLCVAVAENIPQSGKIQNFLLKDTKENRVYIHQNPVRGARTAITLYNVIDKIGELNLVECELITGRTHQIRVHLASLDAPLLGDSKYGLNAINRKYKEKYQLLCSYKLKFDFPTDAGDLNYLKGREFTLENIDFRDKYFSR